jgi:hypothetical protein
MAPEMIKGEGTSLKKNYLLKDILIMLIFGVLEFAFTNF